MTFTVSPTQASVLLGRPDDDTLQDEPDEEVRRTMGGKTYDIGSPRDITVFVKQK